MQPAETEAVVTWCLAACRESEAPRATFDELMEIVAESSGLSADDLGSIRRSFIRRMVATSSDPDPAVRRRPAAGEFLASRRVATYFPPCLARCRRSNDPFGMLARALAALARAPDWTEADLHELRMRVAKALLDEDFGLSQAPKSDE